MVLPLLVLQCGGLGRDALVSENVSCKSVETDNERVRVEKELRKGPPDDGDAPSCEQKREQKQEQALEAMKR